METAMVLAIQSQKPKTYEDLLALPDDGKRYELFNGVIVEMPAPLVAHQRLLMRLGSILLQFFDRHENLGDVIPAPVDVRLAPHFVFQPDLVVLLKDNPNYEHLNDLKLIEGAPDLVIEILSPTSLIYDAIEKAANYSSYGVREYWIVDPDQKSVDVRVLHGREFVSISQESGVIRSEIVPGLSIDHNDLFRSRK
jgi:Uma2 family endonuclease